MPLLDFLEHDPVASAIPHCAIRALESAGQLRYRRQDWEMNGYGEAARSTLLALIHVLRFCGSLFCTNTYELYKALLWKSLARDLKLHQELQSPGHRYWRHKCEAACQQTKGDAQGPFRPYAYCSGHGQQGDSRG